MKRFTAFAVAAVVALVVVAWAPAQTGDATADGNSHPNVGALLRKRTDGSLTIVCSGTLVSPRVFLTAGHCSNYLLTHGQPDAYVTFALNPDGSIDQAKMRAVSPTTDFSFDFQDLLLKPIK